MLNHEEMMNEDAAIEQLIEEAFHNSSWLGGDYPYEEAITKIKQYRRRLNVEDRQCFDQQICLGQHPLFAIESVEITSGRLKSQLEFIF